jgi:hypothetical protein
MKQLLTEIKTYLLDYSNTINFPSYEQSRKTPILTQNQLIDTLEQFNLQSGLLALNEDIVHLNNIYFIELTSLSPFHIFVNDVFIMTTHIFSYKNLSSSLTKLSLLNYSISPTNLVVIPDNLSPIFVDYVLLNE